MKEQDFVILTKDRQEYLDEGIKKGRIGFISEPEIRDNCFFVAFEDEELVKHREANDDEWFEGRGFDFDGDIPLLVRIEDLEFYEDGGTTDEQLLEALPKNNPKWWCKVENGYILNLLGEKKNKIPYDYNS